VKRREFIALAGVAAAFPCAARAQASRRLLGLLFVNSAQIVKTRGLLDAVTQGLKEYGWVEGQNITFEARFAEGRNDLLTKMAAELVQLRPDVILSDGTPATQAAKTATRTIPIVALHSDPIASGFVASLNRPGGNITGISVLGPDLAGKRLQLLTEIDPRLARVGVLSNPSNPSHALVLAQTRPAAQSLGIDLHVAQVSAPDELEDASAAITRASVGALIVLPEPMLFSQHPRVVAYAAAARLPALFPEKQVADAGGLMAYGPSIPAAFRRLAAYTDKILRGANPADLPVEQPTKFELVINLKTAKALGVDIPPTLLAVADEVIE
jgi:putative ABC transport system substrate-binding protein